MKNGRMQAKDLDDARVLAIVRELRVTPWLDGFALTRRVRWVFVDELVERLGDVPRKVVLAKLASMRRRKLLDCCTCGCRGDIELPDRYDDVNDAPPIKQFTITIKTVLPD